MNEGERGKHGGDKEELASRADARCRGAHGGQADVEVPPWKIGGADANASGERAGRSNSSKRFSSIFSETNFALGKASCNSALIVRRRSPGGTSSQRSRLVQAAELV